MPPCFSLVLTEKDSAQANKKKPHKKQAKASEEVSDTDSIWQPSSVPDSLVK